MKTDYSSEVMQRSYKKGYIGVHPSLVISIIVLEHTTSLDFEIEEEHFAEVFHALETIVSYYQAADLPYRSGSLYTSYEYS